MEEGLYLKTNLDEMIEEIIISPYSPKWFYNLVKEISAKYGISKPINRSKLSLPDEQNGREHADLKK